MGITKLLINDSVSIFKIKWVDGVWYITYLGQDGFERKYIVTDVVMHKATNTLYYTLGARSYKALIASELEPIEGLRIFLSHIDVPYRVNRRDDTGRADCKVGSSLSSAIKSPLAGRVTSLLVIVGQSVNNGTSLMTIESMKMENEITAIRTGVVKTIFIRVGDVIQPNQTLIEFENEGEFYAASPTSPKQETTKNT